jgi:hypothetical protein
MVLQKTSPILGVTCTQIQLIYTQEPMLKTTFYFIFILLYKFYYNILSSYIIYKYN